MSHVLPPDMPEAAAAYVESMPEGRVELFALTPLDRTGVACWNAVFLNEDGARWHGVTPHGVGYGVDDASAIIGTTGELAEAVHSAAQIQRMPRQTGSYASLRDRLGAAAVADPMTLCLPAGSVVDHETVLEWVPGRRWPGGGTVWVPIDIAACSVGDLAPGYVPFTTPITNGLGAGPTLDFAIGHGLGELLQRDGNGLGFRAMDRGIALDLGDGPRDPRTAALLARLTGLGIEALPKFATTEFGTANVYCVGAEREGVAAPWPIMVTACGEAASLDREHALRKALFEFAAARMRKVFSHAPMREAARVAPPGYIDRIRAYHTLGGEESRALSAMVEWLRLDQAALKLRLADSVLSRQGVQAFEDLPTWGGPLSGTALVAETGPAVRGGWHGGAVCRLLAAGCAGRACGEGDRPGARGRDDELSQDRGARRAEAAGAGQSAGRRGIAAGRRGPGAAAAGNRPGWRVAGRGGGGPDRGRALSAVSGAGGA